MTIYIIVDGFLNEMQNVALPPCLVYTSVSVTTPNSERPYFQQSAPILARNPKTILRNTEYTPILRRLFEKRAKIGAECPK